MTGTVSRPIARLPRVVFALLVGVVLVGRALLPGAEGAPLVLLMLAGLAVGAVLVCGASRVALTAAIAGVAAVVLLPAGELCGLIVGSTSLVAAILAGAELVRGGRMPGPLDASALALVGTTITAPERLLAIFAARAGDGLASGAGALLVCQWLGPALALGVATAVLARLADDLQPLWLLGLTFAIGGRLDLETTLALPLLAVTALTFTSSLPRWKQALGAVFLAAGAILAPGLTLLAVSFTAAHRSRMLAVLLAGAAAVATARLDLSGGLLVLAALLAAAALTSRPRRELAVDLVLLAAGTLFGPGGIVLALARIAPRPEPWLASLATLGLFWQSFPWLGRLTHSHAEATLAAAGLGSVAAVGLALALVGASLAALRLAQPKWSPALAVVLIACPWILAVVVVSNQPVGSPPSDLAVSQPLLDLAVAPPRFARALILDSQLAFAHGLEAGAVVAEVSALGPDGEVLNRWTLRNGVDTAEWAERSSGVSAPPGPSWIQWVAPSQLFLGSRSRSILTLAAGNEPNPLAGSSGAAVGHIHILREPSLPPEVLLTVHGVALR